MSLCRFFRIVVLAIAFVETAAANRPTFAAEWIRGSGKDLELRIRGEVVNEEGKPEFGAKVAGKLRFLSEDVSVTATTTGNQFEVWLPVNRGSLWWSRLTAESADGRRFLSRWVHTPELRQLAIDGMTLVIEPPTRHIDVRVVDQGKPVADAWVKLGEEKQGKTNKEGVARFGLGKTDTLDSIMAWAGELQDGDRRVGGLRFNRAPERETEDAMHEVELSRCRDQKIRLVDEKGKGIAGVEFVIQIGTPKKYDFAGINENSHVTTDANGEVVYRWFPDWKHHHVYLDIKSPQWTIDLNEHENDGDFMVFKVKRTRREDRRPIRGTIQSSEMDVAGFAVSLLTYQAESEGRFERLTVFTDAKGNYSADALPESTYCTYLSDSRFVSDIVDVGTNDFALEESRQAAALTLEQGTKVEIQVTTGDEKKPYKNVTVNVSHPHEFNYRVRGKRERGVGGPTWYATTDEDGKANLIAPRGALEVNVYEAQWREEKKVRVESIEPITVSFHRAVDQKRKITGRIVLADGVKADIAGTKIKIGIVAEHMPDVSTVVANKKGEFSLEVMAAEVAVFARTEDGKAAGSAICIDLTKPIEVVLNRTIDFEGQLVDAEGKPCDGAKAWITPLVVYEQHLLKNGFAWYMQGIELEATTDAHGNYTIAGVPAETKVWLQTASANHEQRNFEGDFLLDPSDKRPRTISKLRAAKRKDTPLLAGDYTRMLRDCPIMNFHLMVILTDAAPKTKEFVDGNFNDYGTNQDVMRYMQIIVASDAEKLQPADIALMNERGWSMPQPGHVAAIALDSAGKELGRIDLDVASKLAVEDAAAFVRKHIPEKRNGGKMWTEAFIEANRSDKRVIAVVGGRYCEPCFLLAHWMHDHYDILEKDYVVVKIVQGNDENSDECLKQLTRGKRHGIPFFAIYDKSGERLIDSVGPLGNVGYPRGFDGKKWFRKMLNSTRQRLSEADVGALVDAIED
jgi:hypothetical protein